MNSNFLGQYLSNICQSRNWETEYTNGEQPDHTQKVEHNSQSAAVSPGVSEISPKWSNHNCQFPEFLLPLLIYSQPLKAKYDPLINCLKCLSFRPEHGHFKNSIQKKA